MRSIAMLVIFGICSPLYSTGFRELGVELLEEISCLQTKGKITKLSPKAKNLLHKCCSSENWSDRLVGTYVLRFLDSSKASQILNSMADDKDKDVASVVKYNLVYMRTKKYSSSARLSILSYELHEAMHGYWVRMIIAMDIAKEFPDVAAELFLHVLNNETSLMSHDDENLSMSPFYMELYFCIVAMGNNEQVSEALELFSRNPLEGALSEDQVQFFSVMNPYDRIKRLPMAEFKIYFPFIAKKALEDN